MRVVGEREVCIVYYQKTYMLACWALADGKRLFDAEAPNFFEGLLVVGRTLVVTGDELRAYDLDKNGNASNERIVIRNIEGTPDGLRIAANGNLYIACKGVAIYTPQGKLLRTIEFPETPVNVAFGGDDMKTLYVTAHTSVYRVNVSDMDSHQY